MGDEAAHGECCLLRLGGRSGLRSQIVEQPDHYPLVVEQPVDVAEETVDQQLQGDPFLVAACTRTLVVECCRKFSSG